MDKQQLKELIEENLIISLYESTQILSENASQEEIEEAARDTIRGLWRGALSGTGLDVLGNWIGSAAIGVLPAGDGRGYSERRRDAYSDLSKRSEEKNQRAHRDAPIAYGAGQAGGLAGSLVLPMGAAGLALRGAGLAARGASKVIPGAVGRATGSAGRTAERVGRSTVGTGAITRGILDKPLERALPKSPITKGALGIVTPGTAATGLGVGTTAGAALGSDESGLSPARRAAYNADTWVTRNIVGPGVSAIGSLTGSERASEIGRGMQDASYLSSDGFRSIYRPEQSVLGREQTGSRGRRDRRAARADRTNESYLGMSYEPEGEMLPESVVFSNQELTHIASIMEAPNSPGPNVDVGRASALNAGILRRGSSGDEVRQIQQLLVDRGYDLGPAGVDGQYGPATERAVRDFQTQRGLQVDGIVGRQTFAEFGDRDPISATHLDGVPANLDRTTSTGPLTRAGRAADLADYVAGALDRLPNGQR